MNIKQLTLLSMLLFTPLLSSGQQHNLMLIDNKSNVHIYNNSFTVDSINKVCAERGHVKGNDMESTLVYSEPYVVDTDSTTVIVYLGGNRISYTCLRCGKRVVEYEKERREVIWKKTP